jgi:hypothetical protein
MVGSSDGFEFVGGSRSMSPLGELLYEAPVDEEDIAVVPVGDRTGIDERADYVPLLGDMPDVSDKSR